MYTLRIQHVLQLLRISRPSGCIVWMHDTSIVGDVDEQILVARQANWSGSMRLGCWEVWGLILPICRLHESLPDVQLMIQRLPPRKEASLGVFACSFLAVTAMKRWPISYTFAYAESHLPNPVARARALEECCWMKSLSD